MNTIANNVLQIFNQRLENLLSNKKNWAHEMASVLNLSIDSVYKKARSETPYTLDEILKLSSHYNIDIAEIIDDSQARDKIFFSSPLLNDQIKNPLHYLVGIDKSFDLLIGAPEVKILYTTRELPVFYYFLNPTFLAFKLYVFGRTVWEIPAFKNCDFSMSLFDPEVFKLANVIWKKYASLISEEFWTSNIMDLSLQQILYFMHYGCLDKSNALQIIDSIDDVIQQLEKMCQIESKSENQVQLNFFLYENKILHTSNHILVRTGVKDMMFLTFDNPNFVYTEDKILMEYSIRWYDKIKTNSYFMGKGTGHLRLQYFKHLRSRVVEAKKLIEQFEA